MPFGQKRFELEPGKWTQISTTDDQNVTVDNFGVAAYQTVRIAASAADPGTDGEIHHFRTLRPQLQQTFTNLDEGTVLWATATSEHVTIEVMTG